MDVSVFMVWIHRYDRPPIHNELTEVLLQVGWAGGDEICLISNGGYTACYFSSDLVFFAVVIVSADQVPAWIQRIGTFVHTWRVRTRTHKRSHTHTRTCFFTVIMYMRFVATPTMHCI
jgi:hypothetical protein